MAIPRSLDEAVEGCAGVVHLASEMGFLPDPNKMITPSLALLNNVLSTAAKTSSVKRVVVASSQAVLPPISEPGVIDSSSWNPKADDLIAYAWAEPYTTDKSGAIYVACKISAERTCWDFVKREKPNFVLNTVVPGFTIGGSIDPRMITSSNAAVLGMLDSIPSAVGFLKSLGLTSSVNLEDCALLHLAALTREDVRNERLLALGEIFDFNRMVDVLGRLSLGSNLPQKLADSIKPVAGFDTKREAELLKALGKDGFTGLEDSVRMCLAGASRS